MKKYLARLQTVYDMNEARSILRMLLEDAFNLSWVDVCLGALDGLTCSERERLECMLSELEKGRPVQYVTGKACFGGRMFHVEEGVLIPRPETEMLTQNLFDKSGSSEKEHFEESMVGDRPTVLDIGCGSGCIAITVALDYPASNVTAWDISEDALQIAARNAESLGANVEFLKKDALHAPEDDMDKWDVIVSNPPYICNKESAAMEKNVLDYEPHLALFVPDDDPLLFYRKIAEYGMHALKPGGQLRYEINSAYGEATCQLLQSLGYKDVVLSKDDFGNDRMVVAKRK